jgi:hypothetical protein
MEQMRKGTIQRLVNLEEKDGLKNTIQRLQNRYKYLFSKAYQGKESNQMKYIQFHLKKFQKMWAGGTR